MLDKEKIRWMTQASIYEKEQGKKDLKRNSYFLSDYIRVHLIENIVWVTVAYLLIAVLYALYDLDNIMNMLVDLEIVGLAQQIVAAYVVLLAVYSVISVALYWVRYRSSIKRVKRYSRILHHIRVLAEKDDDVQREKK